jgi:hypothetical protein
MENPAKEDASALPVNFALRGEHYVYCKMLNNIRFLEQSSIMVMEI